MKKHYTDVLSTRFCRTSKLQGKNTHLFGGAPDLKSFLVQKLEQDGRLTLILSVTVQFNLTKSVMLHGVQHFGSQDSEYTVSTEVKDYTDDSILVKQSGSFQSQQNPTLIVTTALMYSLIVHYVWWKIRNTSQCRLPRGLCQGMEEKDKKLWSLKEYNSLSVLHTVAITGPLLLIQEEASFLPFWLAKQCFRSPQPGKRISN